MATTPTSPLVKLKQRLLSGGGGGVKSETVRVVTVKARDERTGHTTQVKTKGCLSNISSRYRRPLLCSRLAVTGCEGRFRVPATVSLPSANMVVGSSSHRGTFYRSCVSRGNDSRQNRSYYNRRSRSDWRNYQPQYLEYFSRHVSCHRNRHKLSLICQMLFFGLLSFFSSGSWNPGGPSDRPSSSSELNISKLELWLPQPRCWWGSPHLLDIRWKFLILVFKDFLLSD